MDLIGNVSTSTPREVVKRYPLHKRSKSGILLSARIELGDVPSRPYIVCFEEDAYDCGSRGYKTLLEARSVAEKYLLTGVTK